MITCHFVQARVGEIVQIVWTNEAGETLTEQHTAPPKDTWRARSDRSEGQKDYYPHSRFKEPK